MRRFLETLQTIALFRPRSSTSTPRPAPFHRWRNRGSEKQWHSQVPEGCLRLSPAVLVPTVALSSSATLSPGKRRVPESKVGQPGPASKALLAPPWTTSSPASPLCADGPKEGQHTGLSTHCRPAAGLPCHLPRGQREKEHQLRISKFTTEKLKGFPFESVTSL